MSNDIIPQPKQPRIGYSFSDFWVAYFLVLLFLFIKYLLPDIGIVDGLHLLKLDAKQFFSLLVTTVGTLLGILIAALLLSFQLIGKEAKRRKESNILHNSWVIGFACLSLFLVTALTMSYIIVPSFENNNDLSIGYFLLYAFLGFLLLLFYIVHIILGYTNALDNIKRIIASLSIGDFIKVKRTYYDGNWMNANELKLSEIRDEVLYAIRDNDNSALHTMITELANQANKLISPQITREDCEAVVESVTIVWKDLEATASSNQRHSFFEIVANSIGSMYYHAANQKIPLLYYRDLRNYYNNLAENLARKEDIISLKKLITILSNVISFHFKNNCPAEDKLQGLHKLFRSVDGKYSMEASMQWDAINEFVYDINKIQQLSVDYKLKDLYVATHRSLSSIVNHLEHGDFPRLGKFQRAYILTMIIAQHILFNAESALSVGLFEDTLETYCLSGSQIADVIINDPTACPKILKSIGDHLIKARRKSKLNVWLTINEFGAIPRHTAKHYQTNKTVQQATRFIFNVFKKMKEEVEAGQLALEFKTYQEIKDQLIALASTLKEYETSSDQIKLITEIDQCVASFQIVIVTPDFNIVSWPEANQ